MIEDARSKDSTSVIKAAFARQARAFARSPLQTDPRRLARLMEFLGPRRGERVLDVACGPGIVTRTLEQEGLVAIGIDVTREMVQEAVAAGGRFVQGDVRRLPFADRTFDVGVCRNSFHHFTEPAAMMAEMTRVLRPGGRVVVEDMQAPEDEERRAYHETIETLRDVSHARTLTRSDLLAIAAGAGLEDFEEQPLTFVIDFDEWMDRAYPSPGRREKARLMLEACLERDLCGLKVWKEGDRLRFERKSLLFKGTRPGR